MTVDCAAGGTLAEALGRRADELTVEFRGSCEENPVIRRDRVTLRGLDATAELVGGLTVEGSTEVTLQSFSIRDSVGRGIRLRGGSAAEVKDLTVQDCAAIGLQAGDSSFASIENSSFLRNGFAGVAVTENSGVVLAGTIAAHENTVVGFFVNTSSSLTALGDLAAHRNGFAGMVLQVGSSAQLAGIASLAVDDNIEGIQLLGRSSFGASGPITARRNAFGIDLQDSYAELSSTVTIDDSGHTGIHVQAGSVLDLNRFAGATSISGSGVYAIFVDGASATIANTSTSDAVELGFGSRVDFAGGNAIPNLSCDGTVLSRGTPTCPP